jgi:hypothetical protein
MNVSLAERPQRIAPAQSYVASVLHLCNTLEESRDRLIESLPKLTDDQVDQVKMSARALGVYAWLIEAACDDEIVSRIEKHKGGRGNTDDEEEGRQAAVRQQAYKDAKSERTVYRNRQIIQTFGIQTIVTHGTTLQDKGYWVAALTAPDPHEAIESFVEKKTNNVFWEVKDAYKEVDAIKRGHEKVKREFNEAVTTVGRKAAYEWLQLHAEPALDALIRACPIPGFGDRVFKEAIKQCEEQRDALYLVNAQECLLYVWTKGYRTESEMKEFTRLPSVEIRRVMDALTEKGFFVEKEREWKAAGARGGRIKEWCRTAKPMPALHIKLPSGPITVDVVK